MITGRPGLYYALVILILVVSIAAGSVTIWLRSSPGYPIDISTMPAANLEWIHIDGAVANPGVYPLAAGDTVETLLQAGGGVTASANLSGLKLYIPPAGENGPQKISINSADAWLLKALPGVGDVLAQRIVSYREEHGPFRSAADLIKVPGFGAAIYQRIKDMITVAD
ncbi:MAG: helix-hairpin-helix domain-containing protein [Chloroflexi bacterium]|nr:helix-hairpin-helix domain-containing protein [Chloroflexota bacterium]